MRPLGPTVLVLGWLLGWLLVGSTVGEYLALAPVAEARGYGPDVVVRAAVSRFDGVAASVGLAAGMASLVVVGWVRRGR